MFVDNFFKMYSLQLDVDSLTEEENKLRNKYETEFDPNCYLAQYNGLHAQPHKFALTSFHHLFGKGYAKGNSLLEVGCGPTIHSLISGSRHFKHIISSDFLESNRSVVLKWLKNEPGAHDWSAVFKHVAAWEKEEDYHKLEERVRESVKDVIRCDVLQSNPIAPVKKLFDAIITCYCIENSTTSLESYKKGVGNVANLLNPGGTLVIVGEFNGNFYCVGNKRFPSAVITKDVVHDALLTTKLNIVYWSEELLGNVRDYDSDALFVAVAKK